MTLRVALLIVLAQLASACAEPIDSGSTEQASTGSEGTYYACRTATEVRQGSLTHKFVFEVGKISNSLNRITVRQDATGSPPESLEKIGNQYWESGSLALRLGLKRNGAKSIQVYHRSLKITAGFENGFCEFYCAPGYVKGKNQCIAAGPALEDPIGNFIIETVGSFGAGVLMRSVKTVGGSVVRSLVTRESPTAVKAVKEFFRARTLDAVKKNLDDALFGLNPLSGTSAVKGGNCANEAITQAVKLVAGRHVCAVPYSVLADEFGDKIRNDAAETLGVRFTELAQRSMDEVEGLLEHALKESELAILFSEGGMSGHATLVARVKGQLIHINNQNWPEKFSSLKAWDQVWKSQTGPSPSYSFTVLASKIGSKMN